MAASRDFFISYNHTDRAWAEWIATELENGGHTTYIQAWDFPAGTNFVLQMHEALQQSRHVIAVLSPAYLGSGFTAAEWAGAFAADPTSTERRLIPIRVQECEPQGLLGPIVYIDLVGMTQGDQAREKLLTEIRPARTKPSGAIPFPGRRRPARWITAASIAAATLATWAYTRPSLPETYRIRVRAELEGAGTAEGAQLTLSSGGEVKQTAEGWEAVIPRSGLPAGARITLKLEQLSAFRRGERELVLNSDPNPTVTIRLAPDRSARIRGTIVDRHGKAVAGARISVEGHSESAASGEQGNFELPAHAADGQTVRLRAQHPVLGEDTLEAQAGAVAVQFVLDRK